jgi:hypothetical protein
VDGKTMRWRIWMDFSFSGSSRCWVFPSNEGAVRPHDPYLLLHRIIAVLYCWETRDHHQQYWHTVHVMDLFSFERSEWIC